MWKTYQSHMSVLRSRMILISEREQPILADHAAIETDVVLLLILLMLMVLMVMM